MARVKGGWDGQEGPQTTDLVLPKATGDPWERITEQARADMAHKGRLFWAVESMKREQAWSKPAEGKHGDGQRCDLCSCVAAFTWERTPAQTKQIERTKKLRGSAMPVSWRCAVHVPHVFPELGEQYRDARLVQGAAVAA